jgi:UDP-glucose 4-epimerase
MRSLATGGGGFIGSHVARHCLELGHEVVVLDDLSAGFVDQLPAGAHFIRRFNYKNNVLGSITLINRR